MRSNIFDKISFVSLFLVITLLPVFVLPFTSIPVETSKGLLVVIGLAVCVICWGLARFFDGTITLPRSRTLLAGLGVLLAFLLSATFSKASGVSFFGTMFDIGTFWFMFAGFLLMLMSSIVLSDPRKAKIVLFGSILSGIIVLLFQLAHVFWPTHLTLGLLAGKTDTIVGTWNALGIFAGFVSLISLLVVEFFSTTRVEKTVLQILTILSLFVIALVNFPFVWELLGIFALIIFVYKISTTTSNKSEEDSEEDVPVELKKNRFPVFSFIIIMVTLLLFMSGDVIGGFLPARLGLQNNEISPSFTATSGVTKSALKAHPVFGMGPNEFGAAWAEYKPAVINTTPFWDVSFNSGSGLLPTFAATTGVLGILAAIIFFFLFITSGIRSIFSSIKNGLNWETMAFFVLSFYLFVSAFFYSTGIVLFLLALAFAGIFIGLSSSIHHKKQLTISYLSDHRKSFFSILFIIVVLIITAGLTFKYSERLISITYFSKAITASDITSAQDSIGKALTLYQNDLYLRTYAEIYLIKLNSLASKSASTLSDADKADLQSSLDQAVKGAQLATTYDPTNYLNFEALGGVYQKLSSFGVKDAYAKAIEAYTTAGTLNPLNPGIKLDMASTAFGNQQYQAAKDYATSALQLKPDYVDAYVLLSQIAKIQGDITSALSYAQTALSLDPTNPDLTKYVQSLQNTTPVAAPAPTPAKPAPAKTTTKKTP